ncbi:MAG: D-alanyl-D-alanine carboxypeptidase family protein [Anaerolineae bacterium]
MTKTWALPARLLAVAAMVVGQSLCLGFGPPRLAARDVDHDALWPEQVRQLSSMVPPAVVPAAALLVDMATATPVYAWNADVPLAPASTTKIMTALVALEGGHLDDQVTIAASDLSVDSVLGLRPGEVWTLADLLYALMLSSDNASAVAIARHVAGSEGAFVEQMNARAVAWGLTKTHFENPHGYDDPNHYSTARDLAALARLAMDNATFRRIVATREHVVGGRVLTNSNQLLGSYEGAEGIKTGTTEAAGQCLVSSAVRKDGHALCVVMGSADRYRDTRLLLDYYFRSYVEVPLGLGAVGLARVRRADGLWASLVPEQTRVAFLPRWQLPWLRVQRVVARQPAPGGTAGLVRYTLGTVTLAQVPLHFGTP